MNPAEAVRVRLYATLGKQGIHPDDSRFEVLQPWRDVSFKGLNDPVYQEWGRALIYNDDLVRALVDARGSFLTDIGKGLLGGAFERALHYLTLIYHSLRNSRTRALFGIHGERLWIPDLVLGTLAAELQLDAYGVVGGDRDDPDWTISDEFKGPQGFYQSFLGSYGNGKAIRGWVSSLQSFGWYRATGVPLESRLGNHLGQEVHSHTHEAPFIVRTCAEVPPLKSLESALPGHLWCPESLRDGSVTSMLQQPVSQAGTLATMIFPDGSSDYQSHLLKWCQRAVAYVTIVGERAHDGGDPTCATALNSSGSLVYLIRSGDRVYASGNLLYSVLTMYGLMPRGMVLRTRQAIGHFGLHGAIRCGFGPIIDALFCGPRKRFPKLSQPKALIYGWSVHGWFDVTDWTTVSEFAEYNGETIDDFPTKQYEETPAAFEIDLLWDMDTASEGV